MHVCMYVWYICRQAEKDTLMRGSRLFRGHGGVARSNADRGGDVVGSSSRWWGRIHLLLPHLLPQKSCDVVGLASFLASLEV